MVEGRKGKRGPAFPSNSCLFICREEKEQRFLKGKRDDARAGQEMPGYLSIFFHKNVLIGSYEYGVNEVHIKALGSVLDSPHTINGLSVGLGFN